MADAQPEEVQVIIHKLIDVVQAGSKRIADLTLQLQSITPPVKGTGRHRPGVKNRGMWTARETRLFGEAIEMYPGLWHKIAGHVGSRTAQQCRGHFKVFKRKVPAAPVARPSVGDKQEKKGKELDLPDRDEWRMSREPITKRQRARVERMQAEQDKKRKLDQQ